MGTEKILELKNITKLYPGVRALDNVSLDIYRGEIHAIMGENGAGKSTLIKIIGGAVQPSEGKITVNGKSFSSFTSSIASENGIGVIYQEFNLVPSLSVAENVCLGNKLGHKIKKDKKQMKAVTDNVLKNLGLTIDAGIMVSKLSTGQQQMVEIAKQMVKSVKILILDEPTASLSLAETRNLLDMVRQLRDKGVTILYISHRLDEVFEIADRVSVFRDGKYIETREMKETTRKDLIRLMVGREIGDEYPKRTTKPGEEVVLEVKALSGQGDKNITFSLHKGEILGVAGLVGAGRTEMAKMLYGYLQKETGEIWIHGRQCQISSPQKAISMGIGLIPEDRKREGVFIDYPIDWNIPIMSVRKMSKGLFPDKKKMQKLVNEYIDKLAIATPSPKQVVRNLSGGNQQKVVLAKTLAAEADILIMDEPTRGIDVGTKQEIYRLMNELVAQGKSIIMISSEMEEVMGVSDRILIFYEGEIMGVVDRDHFDQNLIMARASGIKEEL